MRAPLFASLLCLLALCPLSSQEAEGLRLEGGPFRPYALERAVVRRPGGLGGRISIFGLDWDGRSRLLFQAEPEGYAERLDVAFYFDEETKALSLELSEPAGRTRLELPLLGRERPSSEELDMRTRIRSLPFPSRGSNTRRVPAALLLEDDSLESAGRKAASEGFALPRPRSLLPILGSFALFAAAFHLLPISKARAGRALFLGASFLASLSIAATASNRPMLFVAAFPSSVPGARLSGLLEAREEQQAESTILRYGEAGAIELLGIRAPGDRGLSLDLLEEKDARFRFAGDLLIQSTEGRLEARTEGLLLGWRIHEDP